MITPPGGVSLHIMESLFLVSVQKTSGTEVAYGRDSTSYSGAEYSWSPTEKMYGEGAFIFSQCGPIMNMMCCFIINPVTLWVLKHLLTTSFKLSLLMMMKHYLMQMNLLT